MERAAKAGVIGAFLDVAAVMVIGALTVGHDPIHGYISTLGTFGAPLRGWYVLAGSISTVLHIWFAIGLRRALGGSTSVWISATLLGQFFILQWLGAAIFPCDPGCQWLTFTGRMHYALSFTAFVMFCIGIIVTTWLTHQVPVQTRTIGIDAAAVFCIACALALLAADRLGEFNGLVERITIIGFSTWTLFLAFALPERSGRSPAMESALGAEARV